MRQWHEALFRELKKITYLPAEDSPEWRTQNVYWIEKVINSARMFYRCDGD